MDGTSLNGNNEMFTDIRLGAFLQRAPGIVQEKVPREEWYRMAILNGARVAGREGQGRLAPGQKADLILLDKKRVFDIPGFNPRLGPWDMVFQQATGEHVHTVMVGGKLIRERRRWRNLNEEGIRENYLRILEKRIERLEADRGLYERLEPYVVAYYQKWEASEEIASPLVYRYNQI